MGYAAPAERNNHAHEPGKADLRFKIEAMIALVPR